MLTNPILEPAVARRALSDTETTVVFL